MILTLNLCHCFNPESLSYRKELRGICGNQINLLRWRLISVIDLVMLCHRNGGSTRLHSTRISRLDFFLSWIIFGSLTLMDLGTYVWLICHQTMPLVIFHRRAGSVEVFESIASENCHPLVNSVLVFRYLRTCRYDVFDDMPILVIDSERQVWATFVTKVFLVTLGNLYDRI